MDTSLKANAAGRKVFRTSLISCAATLALTLLCSASGQARDLSPEIVSRAWFAGNTQVATVTLNGDEIARFKSDRDSDEATSTAEDLAARLQEIITDRKFDANSMVPSKEDSKAVRHMTPA